jgi:hypothetical protein
MWSEWDKGGARVSFIEHDVTPVAKQLCMHHDFLLFKQLIIVIIFCFILHSMAGIDYINLNYVSMKWPRRFVFLHWFEEVCFFTLMEDVSQLWVMEDVTNVLKSSASSIQVSTIIIVNTFVAIFLMGQKVPIVKVATNLYNSFCCYKNRFILVSWVICSTYYWFVDKWFWYRWIKFYEDWRDWTRINSFQI